MTVYYLDPHGRDVASGGAKKLCDHVDILNAAGIDAAVLHHVDEFRHTWFPNATRMVYAPIELDPGEVIAVPEVYGDRLETIAPGVPRASINQNAFHTFRRVHDATLHPYATCKTLVGIAVISEHSERFVRHCFPQAPVERLRLGIDPVWFSYTPGPRSRRIAYMSRRRALDAERILCVLSARGALEGWTVSEIDGVDQRSVADALGESAVFLSFSEAEGFGLPPAEAIARGCVVVGYTGFGGGEYFELAGATTVDDGDVLGFATAAEAALRSYDSSAECARRTASERVLSAYSLEHERADVVAFWNQALDRAASLPRAIGGRIEVSDVRLGTAPVSALRRYAHDVRRALLGRGGS